MSVQFGGQTAINLAEPLSKAGVKILGTQVADLDCAEDRDLFEQALKDLDIPQPPGQQRQMKKKWPAELQDWLPSSCSSIIRSGRTCHGNVEMKMTFVLTCVQPLRQVQTTQSCWIAISLDVRSGCHLRWQGCLIPGIMEHIERAVGSWVYPPQTL